MSLFVQKKLKIIFLKGGIVMLKHQCRSPTYKKTFFKKHKLQFMFFTV